MYEAFVNGLLLEIVMKLHDERKQEKKSCKRNI